MESHFNDRLYGLNGANLLGLPSNIEFRDVPEVAELFDINLDAEYLGANVFDAIARVSFASRDEQRAGVLGVQINLSRSDYALNNEGQRSLAGARFERVVWQAQVSGTYRVVDNNPPLYAHVWLHCQIDGNDRYHAFVRRVENT